MVYSIEDIIRYKSGKMDEEEQYEIEKASLKDPFLAQALEGYENMDLMDLKKLQGDIDSLLEQSKLEKRKSQSKADNESNEPNTGDYFKRVIQEETLVDERALSESDMNTFKVVDEATFAELIKNIVYDFLPDEEIAYDVAGRDLIHELFEGENIEVTNEVGELNFTEHPESIIYFISVTLTAYELFKELRKNLSKGTLQELGNSWSELMRKKGIEDILAEKIANKYIINFI